MKQAAILVVLLAITSLSFANRSEDKSTRISSGDTLSSSIFASSMQNILEQIKNVAGINMNFEIKEADVLNIEATIKHRKKYILYNSSFISSLNNAADDKWSVIALVAHEIGHHIIGHTKRRGGSKPALELEADEFAGSILYKLGATLEQSQNVMHFISKKDASTTHPGRDARLIAIENGWKKAAVSQEIITASNN
jgi:Zn-dependent peptidase ImmA (M78 family)